MRNPRQVPLRTLCRGLEVLRVVNDHGITSLEKVSEQTHLSRGAVHRVLYTLISEGLVQYANGRYEPTSNVKSLGIVLRESTWISAAQEVIQDLCRKTKLPILVTRQRGFAMEVVAEAEKLSPLRLRRVAIGSRIPLMVSAAGRTLVAYCAEGVWTLLINELRIAAEFPQDKDACAEPEELKELLRKVRRRGYSVAPAGRMTVVAVPIMTPKQMVLGALAFRYFTSAAITTDIVNRHLADMNASADAIGAAVLPFEK